MPPPPPHSFTSLNQNVCQLVLFSKGCEVFSALYSERFFLCEQRGVFKEAFGESTGGSSVEKGSQHSWAEGTNGHDWAWVGKLFCQTCCSRSRTEGEWAPHQVKSKQIWSSSIRSSLFWLCLSSHTCLQRSLEDHQKTFSTWSQCPWSSCVWELAAPWLVWCPRLKYYMIFCLQMLQILQDCERARRTNWACAWETRKWKRWSNWAKQEGKSSKDGSIVGRETSAGEETAGIQHKLHQPEKHNTPGMFNPQIACANQIGSRAINK